MAFADHYISNFITSPFRITDYPDQKTGMTIVIPCMDEPNLIRSLESIHACIRPPFPVAVIVVVNEPEDTSQEIRNQNQKTLEELAEWKTNRDQPGLRYFYFHAVFPKKHAGVGLARKSGMDEAVRFFNLEDNPDGIIVCFDADAVCSENLLVAIGQQYRNHPGTSGTHLYFEHPLKGLEFDQRVYDAILQYELYLRYFNQLVRFTGYPYAFHTVGSCINVKASAYCRQGGMNRRQAGEDFYFLQKIIPDGEFYELNNAVIHPSPRPSFRVPFGTGASIKDLTGNDSRLLQTYDPDSCLDLRWFFGKLPYIYNLGEKDFPDFMKEAGFILSGWLQLSDFKKNIIEIRENAAGFQTFCRRFFNWFNGLMILRYLNYSHNGFFQKIPVNEAASRLFERIHQPVDGSSLYDLLMIYRNYEKENPHYYSRSGLQYKRNHR